MSKDPGRILIFDTTLRDGEQSPGASLNLEEKLAIAHQLARLGVDVIEAGFPFASNGNASDVGDLTQARYSAAGQSSTTHGYTSGGIVYPPFAYRNTIDKFPFSSDTNATDVGDLLNNVGFTTGQQV